MEDNIIKNIKIISQTIKILPEYCLNSPINGFVECLFNINWLRSIIKDKKYSDPPIHNQLQPEEIVSFLQLDEDIDYWQKYLVQVLQKKDEQIYALPRRRNLDTVKDVEDLAYPQLLNYVSVSNMKNIWADCYQNYQDHVVVYQWKGGNRSILEPYNKVLKTSLLRFYKCPIIPISDKVCFENCEEVYEKDAVHLNIHPAMCVLESDDYFFLILSPTKYNLFHCVNFSLSKLQGNETSSLFLLYQFCQSLQYIHECGLFLGNVSLHHICLDSNFHLSLIPSIQSSLFGLNIAEDYENSEVPSAVSEDYSGMVDNKLSVISEGNTELTFETFITDRRVTDIINNFQNEVNNSIIDKTEKKVHTSLLCLTELWIAHHIPEFFSEVTYFVYKARITPKQILQKHVRQLFVASHYPASIARMYALTPEECIPEFYCYPLIFKSIHTDLPDLEVPQWCSGIEDFVDFHRQSLESNYVSRRLHHWIDLYYGYKLSGSASVKAKNVCLSLVDSHTSLSKGGVVQLFNIPHPQKLSPSPFLGKTPPMVHRIEELDSKEEKNIANTSNPKETTSKLSKQLSGPLRIISKENQSNNNGSIDLPPNYNPLTALNQLEMLNNFKLKLTSQLPNIDRSKPPKYSWTAKEIARKSRNNDMKVVACIIVQMLCPLQCRILNPQATLEQRYQHTKRVFREFNHHIPKCLHYFLKVIFDTDQLQGSVTSRGLPPPTAYQILQPNINVISFPSYFKCLTSFIKDSKLFRKHLEQAVSISDERSKRSFAENYIYKTSLELQNFLPELTTEGLKLILPYVVELFRDPVTSVYAAWHLTDVVVQILELEEAKKSILPHLIKLFNFEVINESHCKLFQQNYLLQLMIRFGLKTFLAHFITPIIEAVGGYKTFIEGAEQCSHIHRHSPNLKKLGKFQPIPLDEEENQSMKSGCFQDSDTKMEPENDLTDLDMDSEMFMFEKEDTYDVTDGYEDLFLGANERVSTPVASDTESFEECSLQGDRVSVASVSASPVSNSLSGDDDRFSNNDSNVEYPKVSKKSTLSIPIPAWKMHQETLDGSTEYSRSLPEQGVGLSYKNSSSEEVTPTEEVCPDDQVDAGDIATTSGQMSIAEICCENVLWLAQKLGPVLTARFLTRNLLRMLTLCYTSEFGALHVLKPPPKDLQGEISITKKWVVGDKNSIKVLFCLSEIAKLYGEQVILVQYLSHITELVGWCGSKFAANQEGALLGAMSLLQHILQRLSDTTFMDHLQETLIRNAVYPVIRLLSSVKVYFPNGTIVRRTLAWRVVDSLYIMAHRVGVEMSKEKLSPAITRFLTAFDKVNPDKKQVTDSPKKQSEDHSPEFLSTLDQKDRNLEEMKAVFTPELAYLSYLPFCQFLGIKHMKDILPCHFYLQSLCLQYDENISLERSADFLTELPSSLEKNLKQEASNKFQRLFGSDVAAVTGNRIDIKDSGASFSEAAETTSLVDSSLSLLKHSNLNDVDTKRHLKGNWLAYWEHEIGRNDQNKSFNLKQIKLQSFVGHASSVKSIYALDNENSFISCSKDKTVKLWSLRSQGEGNSECKAQWTYSGHKKSVFGLSFCEPLRLVASCDSTIHIWDPFTGTCLKQLDSLKHSPVTVLCSMARPSTQLIAATTDSTLKIVDLRTFSYAQEMKITCSSVGLVRCLATSRNNSHLMAVAHSSGVIATLDLRTGQLLATLKPHEGEVLTLKWYEKGSFISSALDQTISVWSVYDKRLKFPLKGPTEPVHLLRMYENEIITGTTANRIGLYTSVAPNSNFSSTRLRSETFRGVLTAMEVLPLNRQLLIGSDNGTLQLIC